MAINSVNDRFFIYFKNLKQATYNKHLKGFTIICRKNQWLKRSVSKGRFDDVKKKCIKTIII